MPVCLEVAETATKPSPAPLQKHSLGDATGQAGVVRGYPTSAVWAADLQHLHSMSNAIDWGEGGISFRRHRHDTLF